PEQEAGCVPEGRCLRRKVQRRGWAHLILGCALDLTSVRRGQTGFALPRPGLPYFEIVSTAPAMRLMVSRAGAERSSVCVRFGSRADVARARAHGDGTELLTALTASRGDVPCS